MYELLEKLYLLIVFNNDIILMYGKSDKKYFSY